MVGLLKRSITVRRNVFEEFEPLMLEIADIRVPEYTEAEFKDYLGLEGEGQEEYDSEKPLKRFIYQIAAEYIRDHPESLKDELTCYRLLVGLQAGSALAGGGAPDMQFVSHFPKSDRSSALLWNSAARKYSYSRPESNEILLRIQREFPGSKAKEVINSLLLDWWTKKDVNVEMVSSKWTSAGFLQKGQRFRIVDVGSHRFSLGAYGEDLIDINDLQKYQGPSIQDFFASRRSYSSSGNYPGFRSRVEKDTVYTAHQDGVLHFNVYLGGREFEKSLPVTLEIKDQAN